MLGSILRLGGGEAVSRLASFGLYAYISRSYGLELLGIVALSQIVATYATMGTDQGLRMIGARTVARSPGSASGMIRHILRKRLISCVVCVALGSVYALWGPVPATARLYVLGFVLAVIPYAFSLDWLAWGLDHLGWLGAWRGAVGVTFVLGAIAGMRLTRLTLLPLTLSNGVSAALGALLLWALWQFRWRSHCADLDPGETDLEYELRWGVVLPLGLSTILNLMFNNFDTVMLAAMTSTQEVGRYSAAYKILFVVFGGYYLLTQSLYPKLSRAKGEARLRRLLRNALLGLVAIGALLAVVISMWAASILHIIYGSDIRAVGLLRILSLAIPMDFCAALMGTVLVSRGYDKPVLWGAVAATICNVSVNFLLIPRFGATGAAWATLVSYLVLLIVLGMSCRLHPIFAEVSPEVGARDMAVPASV
jgi:O-antigen/teichoic acid export membrane protein